MPKSPKGPRVDAVSEFRRLATFERYALVEVRPLTGRLHQIRRHLKHISCPLIGDVRYGKGEHNRRFRSDFGLHRLALHCCGLEFPNPEDDQGDGDGNDPAGKNAQMLRVTAPLHDDLAQPLSRTGLLDAALAAIGEWPE